MFDELHDPNPPTPGLHEFAAVAERAHQIRRRRNTWIVRAASLAVMAGAALAFSQMADRTATAPTDAPATSQTVTTVPVTTVASTVLPLPAAIGSTLLPAIGLGPGMLTVNPEPIVELFEDENGGVCMQIDGVVLPESCTPVGTGFYASAWPGGQVIAVDPAVDASIDAAGAGCTQQFPDFAVVQVWICSDLDLDAATVDFVGDRRVVVHGG